MELLQLQQGEVVVDQPQVVQAVHLKQHQLILLCFTISHCLHIPLVLQRISHLQQCWHLRSTLFSSVGLKIMLIRLYSHRMFI